MRGGETFCGKWPDTKKLSFHCILQNGRTHLGYTKSLSHLHFCGTNVTACAAGASKKTAAQLFYAPQALPVIEHTALSQVFILWLHFWACATVCHCVPWGLHCFFIKPSSCRNVPQLYPAHIPQLSLPRKRRGERPVNAKVLLAPVRSWDAAKDRPTGS